MDGGFFNAPQSLSERSDGDYRSGFSDYVVQREDGSFAPAKRRSNSRLGIGSKPAKSRKRAAPGRAKTAKKAETVRKPVPRKAKAAIAKPAAKKVPRMKAVSSPKAREDKNKVCGRPKSNKPKGGGGGARRFIPWAAKPC